jgi:hypothetical protein
MAEFMFACQEYPKVGRQLVCAYAYNEPSPSSIAEPDLVDPSLKGSQKLNGGVM